MPSWNTAAHRPSRNQWRNTFYYQRVDSLPRVDQATNDTLITNTANYHISRGGPFLRLEPFNTEDWNNGYDAHYFIDRWPANLPIQRYTWTLENLGGVSSPGQHLWFPDLRQENASLFFFNYTPKGRYTDFDRHAILWSENSNELVEVYRFYAEGSPGADSVVTYNLTDAGASSLPRVGGIPCGVVAAKIPLAPFMFTMADLVSARTNTGGSGDLGHMLGMVLANYQGGTGNQVWPARGNDGQLGSGYLKAGQVIRLKANYDFSRIDAATTSTTHREDLRTLARTMQRYGVMLYDKNKRVEATDQQNGKATLAVPNDPSWPTSSSAGGRLESPVNAGSGLFRFTDFEVVDTSSLATTNDSIIVASVANVQNYTASFSTTKTEGNAPLSTTFSSTSTAGAFPIVSYTWNFGDGTSATGATASKTYSTAGNYNVTLTTVDSSGAIRTSAATGVKAYSPVIHVGTQNTVATTSNVPVPAGLPAGWAVGDLLILAATADHSISSPPAITAPAGWTQFATGTYPSPTSTASTRYALFAKVAVLGEANPAVAKSGTTETFRRYKTYAFRGQNPVLSTAIAQITSGSLNSIDTSFVDTSLTASTTGFAAKFVFNDASSFLSSTAPAPGPSVFNGWTPTYGSANLNYLETSFNGLLWRKQLDKNAVTTSPDVRVQSGSYFRSSTFIIKPAEPAVAPTLSSTFSLTSNPNGDDPNAVGVVAEVFNGSGVYTYAWDFGDGASATGASAGHSYSAAGTYTVGLTVTDTNTSQVAQSFATAIIDQDPFGFNSGDITVRMTDASGQSKSSYRVNENWYLEVSSTLEGSLNSQSTAKLAITALGDSITTATAFEFFYNGEWVNAQELEELLPWLIQSFGYGTFTNTGLPLTLPDETGTLLADSSGWTFTPGGKIRIVGLCSAAGTGNSLGFELAYGEGISTPTTGTFSDTATFDVVEFQVLTECIFTEPTTGIVPSVVGAVAINDRWYFQTSDTFIPALTGTGALNGIAEIQTDITLGGIDTVYEWDGTEWVDVTTYFDITNPLGASAVFTKEIFDESEVDWTLQGPRLFRYSGLALVEDPYAVMQVRSSLDSGETGIYASSVIEVLPANAPPYAYIGVDVYEGPEPLTVTFDGSGSYDPYNDPIVDYTWDFGDGETVSGPTLSVVTHTYQQPGFYTAYLTVTDSLGATGTASSNISVGTGFNYEPNAYFETAFTPTDLLITFDASGSIDFDGTIVSYAWDFGDGQTGTGQVVNHQYAAAGIYSATLTITDNDGATAFTTGDVLVGPFQVELLINNNETYFPAVSTDSKTVSLVGALPAPRNVFGIEWDFGDGTTFAVDSNTPNLALSSAKMVLADGPTFEGNAGAGFEDVLESIFYQYQLYIQNGGTVVSGYFEYRITAGTFSDELILRYEFNSIYDFGLPSDLFSFEWTLSIDHVYPDDGTYTASFSAFDDVGATDTSVVVLTVAQPTPNLPPQADFDILQPVGEPLTAIFDPRSNDLDGTIVTYTWNFGDGTSVSGASATVTHEYIAYGSYRVRLTVTDDDGATDSIIRRITLVAPPDPEVELEQPGPCPPNLLDVNEFRGDDYSIDLSLGLWQVTDGGAVIVRSSAQRLYTDVNTIQATGDGDPFILSSGLYTLGSRFAGRRTLGGIWVFSPNRVTINVSLTFTVDGQDRTESNVFTVYAQRWTWVDVYDEIPVNGGLATVTQLNFTVTGLDLGDSMYFTSPVLTSPEMLTDNTFTTEIWRRLPEYMRDADAEQRDLEFPLLRFIDAAYGFAGQVEFLWDWIRYTPVDDGGTGSSDDASHMVDPRWCCPQYLPWLARLVGVDLVDPATGFTAWNDLAYSFNGSTPEPLQNWGEWETEPDQGALANGNDQTEWFEIEGFNPFPVSYVDYARWQVESAAFGLRGGTVAAVSAAAKQVLQGDKVVRVTANPGPDGTPDAGTRPWVFMVETLVSETPDVDTAVLSSNTVLKAIQHTIPAGFAVYHVAVDSLSVRESGDYGGNSIYGGRFNY